MESLQAAFPKQWADTSTHRFRWARSGGRWIAVDRQEQARLATQGGLPTLPPADCSHSQDMQYAFAYFYYLVNSANKQDLDWEALWQHELDVDQNGCGARCGLCDCSARLLFLTLSALPARWQLPR